MKQHKHAEVLRAIADGIEVEFLSNAGCWLTLSDRYRSPLDCDDVVCWRIKPEDKPEDKPDVVMYGSAYADMDLVALTCKRFNCDSLKLTFDGETGNLKSAEVI